MELDTSPQNILVPPEYDLSYRPDDGKDLALIGIERHDLKKLNDFWHKYLIIFTMNDDSLKQFDNLPDKPDQEMAKKRNTKNYLFPYGNINNL